MCSEESKPTLLLIDDSVDVHRLLSARLKRLVEAGVLERRPSADDAREVEYRLTPSGKDLAPVLIALAQWGDRWVYGGQSPVRFVNRHTGAPLATLELRDAEGHRLELRDVGLRAVEPGTP